MKTVIKFDANQIVSELKVLPVSAYVAWAASCADSLTAAYIYVSQNVDGINYKYRGEALSAVWNYCISGEEANWGLIVERLTNLIPDEDDGASFYNAVADDALAAAAYAVRAILNRDPQEAMWAAQRVYNFADACALKVLKIEQLTPENEKSVIESDIVQGALAQQIQNLSLLKMASSQNLVNIIEKMRINSSKVIIPPMENMVQLAEN